jgi:hypothetical protein
MPEQKTYKEMLDEARKVFGPKAEVSYSNGQWDISTGIEEKFLPLSVKDEFPHAFEASEEYEATYGSTLDRWASKNGYGWSSQAEIFRAYEENVVTRFKEALALVRESVAAGRPFDWPGGEAYKASILKIAEERGW